MAPERIFDSPRDTEQPHQAKRSKLSESSPASTISVSNTALQNRSLVFYTTMEVTANPVTMDELVRSPAIVLTIGSDQIQTTVQASLFRGISVPLHNLLNSPENAAAIKEVLRNDDKSAFLSLVTMAYAVVLRGPNSSLASSPPSNNGSEMVTKKLPNCPDCKKTPIKLVLTCTTCNPGVKQEKTIGLDRLFEFQFTQQSPLTIPQRSGVLPVAALDVKDKATGKRYPLVHYAKVYALATKYEVWGLQYIAVKAFDKKLKKHASEDEMDTEEVLEALRYLASATNGAASSVNPPTTADTMEAQAGGIEGQIDNSSCGFFPTMLLRRLLQYIIAHVDILLDEEEFRDIVSEHGIIGLELMHVLKESMASFSD